MIFFISLAHYDTGLGYPIIGEPAPQPYYASPAPLQIYSPPAPPKVAYVAGHSDPPRNYVDPLAPVRLPMFPTQATCPACNHHGMTRVHYECKGCTTCIVIGLCFLITVFAFCILLCDGCKTAVHCCERCNTVIGEADPC